MDISSVNSDLIRGNVTTIILSSLWSEDRYGYDILKEIESKSESHYTLKQPTLYSVLKRLEKQGLIESYLGEPDDTGGGRRRYYTLTSEGREFLEKERQEYEFSRTILDKLVSDVAFDLKNDEAPFNVSELRPYAKTKMDNKSEPAEKEQTEKEQTIIKEVIKEKVVFKFIDTATGKEIDPNSNSEAFQQIESNSVVPKLENAQTQSYSEVSQSNSSLKEQHFSSKTENQSIENLMQQSSSENQQLSPIMQIISDNAKEENAFTNRLDALGEEKSTHPLSPARTLLDVFNDIDKRDNANNTNASQSNENSGNFASSQSTFVQSETRVRNHASLLDVLAQKEEERELNKARIAAETEKSNEQCLANNIESQQHSQNQINQNYNSYVEPAVIASNNQNADEFVSSFVLPRKKENFSFEQEEIDYRGLLGNITEKRNNNDLFERDADNRTTQRSSDAELKTRLYAKGFKVRPYTKANTTEYYSFNFVLSNRLNNHCFALVLLCYISMIGIMWASTVSKVHYSVYVSFLLIGLLLYAIPLGIYLVNPSKRVRANFNFKLSILNRTMLAIEIAVIVMLVGFFPLGASVSNIDTLIAPIIVPSVLLLNLPLSSVIYFALYRTKKYHIA